jgi:hypothetical protein
MLRGVVGGETSSDPAPLLNPPFLFAWNYGSSVAGERARHELCQLKGVGIVLRGEMGFEFALVEIV